MMNKEKTNNRSNKRNVHLSIRYNDHVMSNLSQNKSNSKQIKNYDEIRVRKGDDNGVSDEFEKEKLGEANVDCEKNSVTNCGLNDKNHKDLDGLNEPKECLDNSEKKDTEELESNRVNNHSVETNSVDLSKSHEKTYASAIKSTSYFETNKLLFVPTELNEIGEEVVVFDEDLVELGSKKWELTLCGHLIGHTMSLPALNYHLRRMWNRFGFKEIVDNGRTKFARVLVEVDVDKGFKETIELQYRDKQHKVEGTKTVNVVYDWKPSICSHSVVFGHDHKSCKVRIRTEEEITKDKADANLNINKENGFVQSKGGDVNRNKVSIFYENSPVLNTKKSQEIHNSKKGKQVGDNNSFRILRDLKDDNIKGINMIKDKMIVDKYLNMRLQLSLNVTKNWSHEMINYFKRSWEADREEEKNDSLDDIEEMIEDVLEDESKAAKNLVDEVREWSCPAFLILPHAMIKKKKSFKFVNFVADKKTKLKAAQLDVSQLPYDSEKKKIAARAAIFDECNEAVDDEEKMLFQKDKIEWLNEGSNIAEEFVNHFDKFLGQSSPVAQLDTLGNIFTVRY
ncbi:hypothetical protein Tco_1264475 [Tanacetum coccineum]